MFVLLEIYSSIFLLFFFFSGERKCVSASGIMGCRWDGEEVRSLSSPYWQAASIDTSPSSVDDGITRERRKRRTAIFRPLAKCAKIPSSHPYAHCVGRDGAKRNGEFPTFPPICPKKCVEMRMSGSVKNGSVFVLPQQTIFSLFLRGCLPFHLFSCHRKRKRRRDGVGPNPPLPKDTRCPFASSSSV